MRTHAMKSLVGALAIVVVLSGLPGALFAQWPNYPTPGVPKGPDGKPDLAGPAPRPADVHPVLSGIWEIARPPRPAPTDGSIPGQLPLSPPPPPAGGIGLGPRPPGLSQFFDI